MERLCERPGCSDLASVAYGMRPADLVFWIDALGDDGDDASHGVLCRRHADSMVVPRNWTLDDQREPDLHLFRPPAAEPARPTARRASTRRRNDGQLALGIDGEHPRPADEPGAPPDADARAPVPDVAGDGSTAGGAATPGGAAADDGGSNGSGHLPDPWTPSFDDADDLDGLLAARSPLLARAFRGADRRHPT